MDNRIVKKAAAAADMQLELVTLSSGGGSFMLVIDAAFQRRHASDTHDMIFTILQCIK